MNIIQSNKIIKCLPNLKNQIGMFVSSYASQKYNGIIRKNLSCCKIVERKELGQPTYLTHPHLFSIENKNEKIKLEDQVTPWITKLEFEERRYRYVNYLISYQNIYFSTELTSIEKSILAKNLIKSEPLLNKSKIENFIAIIPSSVITYMSPDVCHNFKQSSDFLYLTGLVYCFKFCL
jgi:hypothetical protein